MTPEAQRIAIAEACKFARFRQDEDVTWNYGNFNGFENQKKCHDCGYSLHSENWGGHECDWLPDYLVDLNAIHEAISEKSRGPSFRACFELILQQIVTRDDPDAGSLLFYLIHATAAQRAEAFLRTLNLWKD